MIVVFNAAAILPIAFGAAVGYILALSTRPTVGILVGAAVGLAINLGQRLVKQGGPASWLDQRAGGHLYYIPVWSLSAIVLVLTGLVRLGVFTPRPEPARPEVVQNRRPAPEKPPERLPAAPDVERRAPGRRISSVPPSMRPRPAFAEAPVKKITLQDGAGSIQGEFGPQDATDRDIPMPVKIYELAVEADKAYSLEVRATTGVTPNMRVESSDGRLLKEGPLGTSTQPSNLLYVPAQTGSQRIILISRSNQSSVFSLEIREKPRGEAR